MNKKSETRELFTLEGSECIIRGTHHKVRDVSYCAQLDIVERDRIGVLFLNSLSPTRAGKGDSAVYWADSFAEGGYPSFRFDLPGFGDSDGDPPADQLNFINHGCYAPIVCTKIRELVARFNLSGVVLVGLCAGAVSAIHTAAACRECRGVILMDPYFHLPLSPRSSVWGKLVGRIPAGALRRVLKRCFHILLAARVQMPTAKLPSNSNFGLLRHYKELASRCLPTLILTVPAVRQRGVGFDYINYICEQARNNQMVLQVVSGADHTFANRIGRTSVRRFIEVWLNDYFPLQGRSEDVVSAEKSECGSAKSRIQSVQRYLHEESLS